jgi:predicted DNA binding protein
VVEFEGLVPGSDGNTTVFFIARDASQDEIVAASEGMLAIEELRHMTDRDTGTLFKMQVINETLARKFLERGATIRSLTIDAGTTTAVVELSESADVREFVEGLQRDVHGIELLARQPRTRTPDEGQRLQTAFEERLTPRQREVIQLAYRSGYFELPRVQSGTELSEALDISQSTFNYHLRGAERKLLGVVFDRA